MITAVKSCEIGPLDVVVVVVVAAVDLLLLLLLLCLWLVLYWHEYGPYG